MRMLAGSTQIATADTSVALSAATGNNAEDRIVFMEINGRSTNTGSCFIGLSTVDKDDFGKELPKGVDVPPLRWDGGNYGGPNKSYSTLRLGDIYFDAANNSDYIDWFLVVE